LLLDEPAVGLDPPASRELEELIRRLAGGFGMVVVLIEHDGDMIMRTSDEVIALNFGRPFSRGKPEQVRRDPQLVQAYLGAGAAGEPSRLPAYEEESR
jgi:branched-chain amino acid transport system ATP-binding protein